MSESIETVGDNREYLEGVDDSVPVYVSDDGRLMNVSPLRREEGSREWLVL